MLMPLPPDRLIGSPCGRVRELPRLAPEMEELMETLELTRDTVGWQEIISAHLEAGDVVEVRFDTPMLTPQQFADRMGLSRTAVRNWIDRGQIHAQKHGSRWRIPLSECKRFRQWYVTDMLQTMASDMADDLFGEPLPNRRARINL